LTLLQLANISLQILVALIMVLWSSVTYDWNSPLKLLINYCAFASPFFELLNSVIHCILLFPKRSFKFDKFVQVVFKIGWSLTHSTMYSTIVFLVFKTAFEWAFPSTNFMYSLSFELIWKYGSGCA
jgi:hypothetical protein